VRPFAVQSDLDKALAMTRSVPQRRPVRTRSSRLEARISRHQQDLFQRAAELQGRTLTDFVLSSAQEAAVRTIEAMQIIRLSAEDSRKFAHALLNPRKPNRRIRAAARRYLDWHPSK
jgi:uncharacterized protein (DUF1778 family)